LPKARKKKRGEKKKDDERRGKAWKKKVRKTAYCDDPGVKNGSFGNKEITKKQEDLIGRKVDGGTNIAHRLARKILLKKRDKVLLQRWGRGVRSLLQGDLEGDGLTRRLSKNEERKKSEGGCQQTRKENHKKKK